MQFVDTTIGITGVTGFVGSEAAEYFRALGADIRGLVRERVDQPEVEQIVGTINDQDAVRNLARGCDFIIHCVATHGPDFETAERVNVDGSQTIGKAALAAGCDRFIHISTCGVYDLVDVDVVTEDTELWEYDSDSDLVYGVTKAEAERKLRSLQEGGLPLTIMRPPNILGAHPRSTFSHSVGEWLKEGDGSVGGEGDHTWPYVHVQSLLAAIEAAFEQPESVGEAYTIVDGHTTWGDFIREIADWMDAPLEIAEKSEPYDYFYGRFSSEKAERELQFETVVDYRTAMEETKRYLTESGFITE